MFSCWCGQGCKDQRRPAAATTRSPKAQGLIRNGEQLGNQKQDDTHAKAWYLQWLRRASHSPAAALFPSAVFRIPPPRRLVDRPRGPSQDNFAHCCRCALRVELEALVGVNPVNNIIVY